VQDRTLLSDTDLVAHTLRDTSVYAVLVRRWEPPLTRYVRRLLGSNNQSAEDVLQETFLKAYINLNDFDQSRPFGPWIYRIARNEAITFLRKKRIEPPQVSSEDAILILERLSDGITAQEIYDQKRMNEQIRAAINSMDARYREPLMLRYLEDKGYDDIADILELPSGTVATLIHRGTKQLRAALELAASKDLL
jgi:RNA polymerase sigma-70 factor, ECF subfamily